MKITHYGIDGFGHQLLGIISLVCLCKEKNYEYIPLEHHGKFDHLDFFQRKECKKFVDNFFMKYFERLENIITTKYINTFIHKDDNNTLYSFDNSWKHPFKISEKMKKILKDNLPSPNFKKEMNICIHIRGGDSRGRKTGYNNKIWKNVLYKFTNMFSLDKTDIHIHSDENISFENCISYGKYTNILKVLSHFSNCDIFVCGDSSLSIVGALLNDNKVFIPRDTTCSLDKYIKEFKFLDI